MIYNQFLREDKRIVITRWRLSSYELKIETGRYTKPITDRKDRTCTVCPLCIEDEEHVIFVCPVYSNIRYKFRDILLRLATVVDILNPANIKDAEQIGDMLIQIEDIRKSEKLQ